MSCQEQQEEERGDHATAISSAEHDTDTQWGTLPSSPNEAAKTWAEQDHDDNILPDEETVEIAVIGGGIAGLAVAVGLFHTTSNDDHHHHNHNLNASQFLRIYERAPRLRDTSQGGLSLWANGLAALDRLHPELRARVKKAGSKWKGSTSVDVWAHGTVTQNHRPAFDQEAVLVAWHALQEALASFLPPADDVVATNKELVSFRHAKDGTVLLLFADGSRVSCRVAIACDGVFSVARRIMNHRKKAAATKEEEEEETCRQKTTEDSNFKKDEGHSSKDMDAPVYFGHMNWNAIVPTESLPVDSRPDPQSVLVIRSHADPRWYAYLLDVGHNRTFLSCRIEDAAKALAVSGSRGRGGLGLPGVSDRLLPVLDNYPPLHAAWAAVPESQIFERSIVVRVPAAGTWRSGHVVLVGDAAHGMHPIWGQGGNMALESAAALVEALVEHQAITTSSGDQEDTEQEEEQLTTAAISNAIEAALVDYERRRKPRAEFVQQLSNFSGLSWGPVTSDLPLELRRVANEYARSVTGYREAPPPEVVHFLRDFDLRTQEGTALIL